MGVIKELDILITDFINNIGLLAPLIASLLIIAEAILPVLPLVAFVTVNFYYFGELIGFLISWIMACLGGYIVFKFWRHKVKKWFDKKVKTNNHSKINNLMMIINNIPLEKLVLLITIPFAPAFFINMVAGLSNISEKKFVIALLIGKVLLVYFWGFFGTTLIESFNDPRQLIEIGILITLAFIFSKLVSSKYGIK